MRPRFLAACAVMATFPAVASAHGDGHEGNRGHSPTTLGVAGDIACTPGEPQKPPDGHANEGDNCQQAQTADLVLSLDPDAVAIPGDIQYQYGQYQEFLGSFDPTWGRFKDRIFPAAGNHEWYDQPNGQGYFDYFNGPAIPTGRAGTRYEGYYSVDLNRDWHLITLNSNCTSDSPLITKPVPCKEGSPQERWLKADLAAHHGQCIIAQWHHPLYSSGPNVTGPNDQATRSFWRDLYSARATLVLNGHDHDYERFAPQTDTGQVDERHGVREFVIGTGGKSLFGPDTKNAPNSEVYNNTTLGVSLFTLRKNSYRWRFYPEPVDGNGTFTDQGSAKCNKAKGDERGSRGGHQYPPGAAKSSRAGKRHPRA